MTPEHCNLVRPLLVLGMLLQPTPMTAAPVGLTLQAVDTIGSESADISIPTTPLRVPVTALRLQFDRAPAALLSDFRLLHSGANGRLETQDCGDMDGDDVEQRLSSLTHSVGSTGLALRLDTPTALAAGRYRLILCDTLLGLGRLESRDFTVAETSLLGNPGFETDLDGWEVVSQASSVDLDARWSETDADTASASGSIRLHSTSYAQASVVSRECVMLSFHPEARNRMRFRYRVTQGMVQLYAVARLGFAGDMGEAGCLGPYVEQRIALTPSGPMTEFATFDSGLLAYLQAPRAVIQVEAVLLGSDSKPAAVLLDDIGYSVDTSAIFRADFEAAALR